MKGKLTDRCRGGWPPILLQLGVPLSDKALKHKNVPCPLCGGDDRFFFSDREGSGSWHCRHCGYGDGVELVKRWKGVEFKEAAKLIEAVLDGVSASSRFSGAGSSDKPKDPLRSWGGASPIQGTRGEVYFKAREIFLTEMEARSLRYCPALFHWPTQTKWPAVIALVARAGGGELTVHQTFIEPDGSGKAPLEKARLFPARISPIGAGVWFGTADPEHEMIVGEGVESTLSAMRIFGLEAGCAALSAEGVAKLILPLQARRIRIFADNDELGQGVAAAAEAAKRWRGEGRRVTITVASLPGQDANDVLVSRARASR
jgi:putative DNA primase/helicase